MRPAALLSAAIAVACAVAAPACGGDGLDYEGIAGEPTPARITGWVPAVDVAVDGGDPQSFLVDTGAPFTMIDTDSYPAFDDGLHDVDLDAFGLRFPAYETAAFDVFSYDTSFDGIVGGDILRHFTVGVDYKGRRMWLDDAWDGSSLPRGVDPASIDQIVTTSAPVLGGGRGNVPGDCPGGCGTFSVPATRVLVAVDIEDYPNPVLLLLDTGASAVVLDEAFLDALGDPGGRPRLDGVTVGTAAGEVTAYFTRVWSLDVGGAEQRSVAVLVLPSAGVFDSVEAETGYPVAGLLGGSFLRHYITNIDYPGDELQLARYADSSHVDPDEWVGPGFALGNRAGVWELLEVYPGTDAAAVGLMPGEIVRTLDGVDITGATSESVATIMAGFELGQMIPVGVDRGGTVDVVDVLIEDLLPAYEGP